MKILSKKCVRAYLFSAVLVCLLIVTCGVQLVNLAAANIMPPPPQLPSIYIKSDGSVNPPAPIQRDGEVYTFTNNIVNYTIEVQRDNIVVDGAGYTLQGNGSGIGIELKNRIDITIKNLELNQFRTCINIINSSSTTITGNNITNNEIAIALHTSSNNYIEGNKISGNNLAILLYNSSHHNSISGNNITNNGNGIWSEYNSNPSNYNNIVENNIKDNTGYGILLRSSSNDLIEGNNIENNEDGIQLSGSSCQYNRITGNNIASNKNGIYLGGGPKNNDIFENNIENNENGIYLSNSSNNTIYKNNFIHNTRHVSDINMEYPEAPPSENSWNNGFEGNYWSNYTGQDTNGDNIGDSPHIIYGDNQDNYPLVETVQIPEFPSWTPLLLTLIVFAVAVAHYKRRLSKT